MVAIDVSGLIMPGDTVLQRMPRLPYWVATYRVREFTAALEAAEAGLMKSPVSEAPELVLMMEPPPAAIMGAIAYLVISIVPRALMVKARSQMSVDIAATAMRSEEHTSELQSLMRISYAVFCLKKKTAYQTNNSEHKTIAQSY